MLIAMSVTCVSCRPLVLPAMYLPVAGKPYGVCLLRLVDTATFLSLYDNLQWCESSTLVI